MALPKQRPAENQLGTDVTGHLPDPDQVPGAGGFRPADDAVWRLAVEHLHVRSNDSGLGIEYGVDGLAAYTTYKPIHRRTS